MAIKNVNSGDGWNMNGNGSECVTASCVGASAHNRRNSGNTEFDVLRDMPAIHQSSQE